jgi:hypothetical protein
MSARHRLSKMLLRHGIVCYDRRSMRCRPPPIAVIASIARTPP